MSKENPIDSMTIKVSSKKRSVQNTLHRKDPISIEVTDNRTIQNLFKKYPIYPYSGTNHNSGYSLLSFFYRLARLSKTEGSCIKSISDYVIGDGVKVEFIDDEFVDIDDEKQVSKDQKKLFKETIRRGKIQEQSLSNFGTELFKNYKITGDYFFMLILKESLGLKSFELKVVKNTDIMYLIDENKNPIDVFAISPVWDDKYLRDNPPLIVDKYPMFSEFESGIKATIFHNQNGGNRHGKPDSIETTLYKCAEFQNINYRISQTDNAWAGDLIIEMEQGDPENNSGIGDGGLSSTTFEDNFTNKSDNPLSAFITERPSGAGNMFVYQVKPNSREQFYKIIGDIDREAIASSHGWSMRLLGTPVSSGLGSNEYSDDLRSKIPMIKKQRKNLLFNINIAITEIMNWMQPSLIGLGINYSSSVLDKLEESTELIEEVVKTENEYDVITE
jgi:hypothetical protein